MSDYTSNDHAATLQKALDDLCGAMTFRWREIVTYSIVEGYDDFPQRFERHVSSFDAPLWEYWSAAASYHLGYGGAMCAFVEWVEGGQQGELSSVTCTGETGSTENHPYHDENDKEIPPKIDCGMGSILERVESWARAECDVVYDRLPKFDTHDLDAIKGAHDDFLRVGGKLALKAGGSSGDLGDVSFDAVDARDIVSTVTTLAGGNSEGKHWWAGWTGLAASRAKDNFFDSVTPTLENQSCVLAALANLYSARAAIIEKARNDGLYWIQWATTGLHETQTITTDLTPGWKTVQGIGGAISISGSWSGVGGAVGATVSLVGFLGENLMSKVTSEDYKHELEEVVTKLHEEADDLDSKVTELESDYGGAVTDLQTTLFDIHSFDLELYDLTENSSGGDRESDGGYEANVSAILGISEACFEAGEAYDALLPMIDSTTSADKHLADKDGSPTAGDTALLEVRDQLVGFLKTTAGRYILAGEQVKESAEAYAAVETDQKRAFDDTMRDWQEEGVGEYDSDIKPEEQSKDTDRGDFNPYSDSHPLSDSDPGTTRSTDYVTDQTA